MADGLVDAQALEKFLQRLGQCFRHQATLYLVGGTSLLLVAGKMSTFDIDVQFSTENRHHAEFIPLPAGYHDRRRFVARYGSLDVFHFDFYSIALAKIHRGNEKDFDDVMRMIQTRLISITALESYLEQILPDYEFYQPSADPATFRRKFALLKEKLRAA